MSKNNRLTISLIIPVFNEEVNLEWFYKKIVNYFSGKDYNYQITFIDDGSTDNSKYIIKKICHLDNRVNYIAFSRNFGKEAATTAGLHQSKGDATLIIDADGQHPIEMLDSFIKKWNEGYEVVIGVRKTNKGEGFIKKYGSKAFYSLLRFINGKHAVVPGITDFRLIDKSVVQQYNKLTERNRLTRNLIDWLGYNRTFVDFEAEERHAGEAAYSSRKLFKLALDGLVTHSTRPLKFIGLLGIFISSAAVLGTILIIIEKYAINDPWNLNITGSAILGLFLSFLVGTVLVCQGLLALYLENVYHETQNRPLYVIREQG